MRVTAPFTPQQVIRLADWQSNGKLHPFTCANRGDGKHPDMGGDHGILIPTIRGWICPFCDYTQNWCHIFMSDDVETI